MSASLLGGVAGAVIGFMVGGPTGASWGWMAGSTLGGLSERHSAPDLTDLRPQASEYGRPIPIIYSVMAVGGNIIWATDLVKTGDGDGGGKGGGGGGSGPTYAANFAVLICEGDGDIQLGRIWAGPEKRLIYNPTGQTMESGSIRFYDGAGDQLPDPLMESHLGAGNVPAYRGFAYVVLEGFDVSAHDGNRIPFLTIEVGRKGTATPASNAPENLGIVGFDNIIDGGSTIIATYHGTYFGVIQRSKADMSMVHNRALNGWTQGQYVFYDSARDTIVRLPASDVGGSYTTLGMGTGTLADHGSVLGIESGAIGRGACMANNKYVFAFNRPSGAGIRFYSVDPATNTLSTTQTFDASGTATLVYLYGALPADGYVWGITSDNKIRRFNLDGSSTTSVILGDAPPGFSGENQGRYDPLRDALWLVSRSGSDATLSYAVVSETALLNSGNAASIFNGEYGWLFTPTSAFVFGNRWLAVDHYFQFDVTTYAPAVSPETDGVYVGTATLQQTIYNDATGKIVGLRDGGAYAISTTDQPNTLPASSGYMGGADVAGGSTTLQYQTLAQVVTDLSLRAGLTAGDINVTALTDQVDGYMVANQVSVKEAISAQMPAYFFDAVEDQGKIVFVKRGGAIAVEIPADDLGAHPSGQDGSDLYEVTRVMDEELPRTHSVNYISAATKYSQATKYARRLIGYSGDESRAEFPMVFTDQKAQEIADVNLHTPWVERMKFKFSLPLKYAYLMPTDIVGIDGYTVRITKMTQKGTVFDCEGVRDDSHVYTPHVIVTPTPPPDETVAVQSLTLLELM